MTTTNNTSQITEREHADGLTLLGHQYRSQGGITAATSANGRWGYERETGRLWLVIDNHGLLPVEYCASLRKARRHTYDIDHPSTKPATTETAQYSLRGGPGRAIS